VLPLDRRKKDNQTKFIFVTGGVLSSLGKGLAAASIGALLESRGLKITFIKLDPYLNVDPGTMNPFQHGEVYVTDDGSETDLDLGHYERFTDVILGENNNFTSGQIFNSVIQKERKGEYLGKTIQVIPHITNEIKDNIRSSAKGFDICIVEIGGTVGDIESLPFLEATRQICLEEGFGNCCNIHVTLVPFIKTAGELKTKPTQHSVQKLREIGHSCHIILCRSDQEIPEDIKAKIGLFCHVPLNRVIACIDQNCIYKLPVALREEGLDDQIAEILNIWSRSSRLEKWEKIGKVFDNPKDIVKVGLVGKYVDLVESYKSLTEAIQHACFNHGVKPEIIYIDSEKIEASGDTSILSECNAVIVPGGFGHRGIEGKIKAVNFVRENKVPFLGICLGMQISALEIARNCLGISDANSLEFDSNSKNAVIHLMEEQKKVSSKGATMRLGSYPCSLKSGSVAAGAYKAKSINERHRHRYEFNNDFREVFEESGVTFSGLSPDGNLVEIMEIADHPFFLGCQFHPEYKSGPTNPHPLFNKLIEASLKKKNS